MRPLFALLISASFVCADSLELKDGTRVEGKITSLTPEEVIIEIRPTPSIIEEKTFSRAEIARVHRTSPDDVAFAEIESITIPDTVGKVGTYDALLDRRIRPFMENFAYSKHMPTVRKLAASLETEKARILGGELKVDGRWIKAPSSPSEESEIGGRLELAGMKQADEPADALAVFEAIEKQHAQSSSYPEAVRLARLKLDELRLEIDRVKTETARKEKEQQEGLQLASADRQEVIRQGMEQERAAVQALIDQSTKGDVKWPPPLPDLKFLEELSKKVQNETERLAKLDLVSMEAAVAAAQRAKEEITQGNLSSARENLAEAEKLWSQHVVLASLRESLQKAEAEAVRTAAESETPSTQP